MKHYLFITLFTILTLGVKGQKDSNWVKYYYEGGQLSSEGPLIDNKPDGYWKSYYTNGHIKTEGNRKDFKLDGPWKFYNEEGKLTLIINYKEDQKNGLRETFDTKGRLVQQENFIANKKEGWSLNYYDNQKIHKKIPFVNNREMGRGFEYDREETVITLLSYKSGVLTKEQFINRRDDNRLRKGTWMKFYDNMQVSEEGMYLKDLKHGFWKFYKSDGNLLRIEKWVMGVLMKDDDLASKIEMRSIKGDNGRIVSSGPYRNSKKEGIHQYYDEFGQVISAKIFESDILLAEGEYDKQGRKQGTWKYYYATGELKEKGAYKDDLKTGKWEYYFLNGRLEQTGSYLKDKPVGTWLWYYADRELRKEEEYANGVPDGMSVEYSDTGTVIAKGEYIDGFKEGEWIYLSETVERKGSYYEGERQGKWKSRYLDNNRLFFEGNYTNDEPDGIHNYYHPNGTLKRKEAYKQGTKNGIWEYIDSKGEVYLTIEYENGKETKYNGVKISYGRRVDRELEQEEQED